MKSFLQQLLREPLIHFALIGGLIFAAYATSVGPTESPAHVIIITPERIEQIATQYESVWRRAPNEGELETLIEEEIREEVYYREAIALGLDKNDVLVRRRMRLKMEFLMDSSANLIEPMVGELEAYLAANEELYLLEPRLAFEQVYFGANPLQEIVEDALGALRSDTAIDPLTLGKPTLLPAELGLSSQDAVSSVFGRDFFEKLRDLPPGIWSGPVMSTYGVHIVRILDSLSARTPQLEEVHSEVLRDWKIEKATEIHDRDYAERRARFVVEIQHREIARSKPQ